MDKSFSKQQGAVNHSCYRRISKKLETTTKVHDYYIFRRTWPCVDGAGGPSRTSNAKGLWEKEPLKHPHIHIPISQMLLPPAVAEKDQLQRRSVLIVSCVAYFIQDCLHRMPSPEVPAPWRYYLYQPSDKPGELVRRICVYQLCRSDSYVATTETAEAR